MAAGEVTVKCFLATSKKVCVYSDKFETFGRMNVSILKINCLLPLFVVTRGFQFPLIGIQQFSRASRQMNDSTVLVLTEVEMR